MLSVIDQHWREHLYEMDYLREGINLRAMGQRDPLAEWQREGFDMFEAMMGEIEDDFVRYIFHLEVVADEAPRARGAQPPVLRARGPGPGRERAPPTAAGDAAARGARRRLRRWPSRSTRSVNSPGAGREDPGPQRALLLRERQEVQALPRPLTRRRRRLHA